MKTLLRFAFLLFGAAASQGSSPAAASEQVVDVELVLAVDVSLSMMPFELEIQRKGYAAAITDPSVVGAIRQGLHGRIAVTYIEWAGDYTQRQVVPWTMIETAEDARAFASTLTANAGGGMRRTSISGAIAYSAGLFDDNGFRGLKRVIDISGDGPNNQGRPVTEARDEAVDRGLIINGLPLMTLDSSPYGSFDIPDLDRYYTRCVIGGPGAFMVPVDGWEQFPEAIRRKLVLELAGVQRSPVIRVAGPALEDTEPYDCLVGERIWQRRFQLYQEN